MKVIAAFFAVLLFFSPGPLFSYSLNEQRADILMQNGEYEDAVLLYEKILGENDTVENRKKLFDSYKVLAFEEKKNSNYLKALYYLKKAGELYFDENLKKSIADTYFKIGFEKVLNGDKKNAVIAFKKVLSYDSKNHYACQQLGDILFSLGVDMFDKFKYKEAKTYLLDAAQYRKPEDNITLYNMLGEIEYYMQEVENAKKYWMTAINTKGIDDDTKNLIQKKINKAEEEFRYEAKLDAYSDENFVIRYDRNQNKESPYIIRSVLRDTYRKIGHYFNYYPDGKITVIIFNSALFYKKTEQNKHKGIRALYDGKIRLPAIDDDTDLVEFKSLLWHEYTHALIHRMAGANCPLWLNEGLAQVMEDKVKPIRYLRYAKSFVKGDYVDFSRLFSVKRQKELIEIVPDLRKFYMQAFLMAKFLIDNYQMYRISNFILALKENKNFEDIFEENFFMSVERFEDKWLKYVESKI